jgi:hypothetical protein
LGDISHSITDRFTSDGADRLSEWFFAQVYQEDFRPFRSKQSSGFYTNATRSSGDDRNFSR